MRIGPYFVLYVEIYTFWTRLKGDVKQCFSILIAFIPTLKAQKWQHKVKNQAKSKSKQHIEKLVSYV